MAADDDPLIAAGASPDGRAEFFLRRHDRAGPDFTVEVTLRGFDALPAVVSVRYPRSDGDRPVVLLPMTRQDIGPSMAQVLLRGFDGGTDWEASDPVPVDSAGEWESSTVTASVKAAVNESTRDAWRQIRGLVSDRVRQAIDEGLR